MGDIFLKEKEKLAFILEKLDNTLILKEKEQKRLEQEISYLQAHFNGDNFQNDVDIAVNRSLLSSTEKMLTGLKISSQKPYFARIDFKEEEDKIYTTLYIGKMNFMEKPGEHPLIVDWRAPVSNLYYESRLGDTEYECPEGTIKGDLKMKRQFIIEKRELLKYYDIDLTTNDELLQDAITANTDNRLKDIAATIQAEQNRIIRSDMWTPIIVQGAAGSGKTTVALHRMAYMIYRYSEKFDPDQFIIIGPNKFFLNYISEVLPELGVANVTQSTFEETALSFIGKKIKLSDKNTVLEKSTFEDIQLKQYKSSLAYKEMLQRWLDRKVLDFLPKNDIKIDKFTVIDYQKISYLFHTYLNYLPPYLRIPVMKEHIKKLMKDTVLKVQESLEIQCNNKVLTLKRNYPDSPKRRELIIKELDYRDKTIEYIKKNKTKLVNKYFKQIKKVSPTDYYNEFLNLAVKSENKILSDTCRYTLDNIKNGYYELDDLAPLMYIKKFMYGHGEFKDIKHVIIDEAQDLSMFQLYALKECTPDSSYTVLGDICQGIYSYRGISDWTVLQQVLEGTKGCKYEILRQSYRNTVEVMTEATKVIEKFKEFKDFSAKPVIRHGKPVSCKKVENTDRLVSKTAEILANSSDGSVAVICKTLKECKKYLKYFKKKGINLDLITGSENEYKGGHVLLPVYHAKGLEFETVILPDVDKDTYSLNIQDAKLLYVAMTRPIHDLYLFYKEELSPLLG